MPGVGRTGRRSRRVFQITVGKTCAPAATGPARTELREIQRRSVKVGKASEGCVYEFLKKIAGRHGRPDTLKAQCRPVEMRYGHFAGRLENGGAWRAFV